MEVEAEEAISGRVIEGRERDVAETLGLSDRMARVLIREWVEDGWLVVADPSKRGRSYELSAIYRQCLQAKNEGASCTPGGWVDGRSPIGLKELKWMMMYGVGLGGPCKPAMIRRLMVIEAELRRRALLRSIHHSTRIDGDG